MNQSNERLTPLAQALRKKMTKEERHLWYDFLRKLPFTVNRQKVIGNYIVDFLCEEARIVIEIDGAQHYSERGREKDSVRDEFLYRNGYLVLRYTNRDINTNFDGVCLDIKRNMEKRRF